MAVEAKSPAAIVDGTGVCDGGTGGGGAGGGKADDGADPGPDRERDDPWTRGARPGFLYVMYALLLWALPVGLVAAVRPGVAAAIAHGMAAYFAALPEPLYTLFGTGYLGYTVARSWGKAKGIER